MSLEMCPDPGTKYRGVWRSRAGLTKACRSSAPNALSVIEIPLRTESLANQTSGCREIDWVSVAFVARVETFLGRLVTLYIRSLYVETQDPSPVSLSEATITTGTCRPEMVCLVE